jgi:hypothetical protein
MMNHANARPNTTETSRPSALRSTIIASVIGAAVLGFATPAPALAQNMLGGAPTSGAPGAATSPARDMPSYHQSLQVALKKLQDASNRAGPPGSKTNAQDNEMAWTDMQRSLQLALGVVRTAPVSFQKDPAYLAAVSSLTRDAQHVAGVNEQSPIEGPVHNAIQTLQGLTAKVASIKS